MTKDDKLNRHRDAQSHFEDGDILSSSSLLEFSSSVSAETNDASSEVIVSAGLPADRVTFSNLNALVPERAAPPSTRQPKPKPVQAADSISVVAPPSFRRFTLWSIGVLILSVIGWVGYRINWDIDRLTSNPINAMQSAIQVQSPASTDSVVQVPTTQIDTLEGRLKIEPVQVQVSDLKSKARFALIKGRVINESNRIQHSISLRITMSDNSGLALASRKVSCCGDADSPDPTEARRLKPGEAASYSLKMNLPKSSDTTLKASVELLFSETDSLR